MRALSRKRRSWHWPAHLLQQQLHVFPDLALLLRTAVRQQKRRMIRHQHAYSLVIVKAPAQLADRQRRLQEIGRRAASQSDQELRLHERELAIEILTAVRGLVGERRAIARRPAFEDVA